MHENEFVTYDEKLVKNRNSAQNKSRLNIGGGGWGLGTVWS